MEKGELDDNGDLKKEINERLLTARQVSRFILYSFAKLILRAFHVWRTLQGSRDISSRVKEVFDYNLFEYFLNPFLFLFFL